MGTVLANRYRDYLEECVSSYKTVITQVCPGSLDPNIPCLSDAVLKRKTPLTKLLTVNFALLGFNNDSAMALIKLGFEQSVSQYEMILKHSEQRKNMPLKFE